MNLFLRLVCILFLLTSSQWWVFAQDQDSSSDKKYDLKCEEKTPACHQTPSEIKTYLEVMDAILKILASVPSKQDESKVEHITTKTAWQKSNVTSFLNEVWFDIDDARETLLTRDGIFDDYKFMETASSTLKRDADKIQKMYFKILDITSLVEKKILFTNVSDDIYKKIDAELKKLTYIKLWKKWDSYNMLTAQKEYATLVKLLSQINQVYAELYQEKFYSELFEDLWTETFKSYTFPTDKTEERVDDEKLNVLYEWIVDFTYSMYVAPFGELKKDNSQYSEYVAIDFEKFALMIWELEHQYRCTHGRQNTCSDGTSKIRESYKELNEKVLQADSKKSFQRIKEATSRLKWALFWWSAEDKKAAEQRKQALLESRYWAWWKPSTRSPMQSLQAFGRELLVWARKSVDPAVNYIDNFKKRSNQETSDITQWAWNLTHTEVERYEKTSSKEEALKAMNEKRENRLYDWWKVLPAWSQLQQNQFRTLENKIAAIQWSFTDYAILKQRERTSDLLYFDTKVMTKQAVGLSIFVHATANRFGDYDKDPESTRTSINETLSKMCEAQCTNLSDKKCREDQ